MTNRTGMPPSPRVLACARCGVEFSCDLSGPCWCMEETAKLPLPAAGEDCLCRACLRKAADARRGDPVAARSAKI